MQMIEMNRKMMVMIGLDFGTLEGQKEENFSQ